MGNQAQSPYSPAFRARATALVRTSEVPLAQVARDLGVAPGTLRLWCQEAAIDTRHREGLTTEERQELVHLRREHRVLREAHERLKKAVAASAGQQPVLLAASDRTASANGAHPMSSETYQIAASQPDADLTQGSYDPQPCVICGVTATRYRLRWWEVVAGPEQDPEPTSVDYYCREHHGAAEATYRELAA